MASMVKQVNRVNVRKLCEKGIYDSLLRVVTTEELRQGFEPDLTQPIHYFAARGNLQAVRELVEKYKCNPECQNVYGITPLHCASYCGRLLVVKFLVDKHKCNVNVKDKKGACPLTYTSYCVMENIGLKSPLDIFQRCIISRSENINTAKFLLSHSTFHRSSLTHRELCTLRLPLHCGSFDDFKQLESTLSLKLGDNSPEVCSEVAHCFEIGLEQTCLDYAKSLLRTYANSIKIAMMSYAGRSSTLSLFHKACSKADIDVVKIFFELDICKPDVQSLKIAIDRKHYELVQFLVQSANHPLLFDRFDLRIQWSSMLSYLFDGSQEHDEKLVRLVVVTTFSTDFRDAEGNTPLHLLCEHSQADKYQNMSTFIPEECTYCYQSVRNSKGQLPVHIACKSESLELIRLVSSQLREDINTQNLQGNTPLHIICGSLNLPFDILKYFINEKKCNVNSQNNLGQLPLHIFIKKTYDYHTNDELGDDKSEEFIKLLTSDQCFGVNAQDNKGNTPLHIACKKKELLQSYFFWFLSLNVI